MGMGSRRDHYTSLWKSGLFIFFFDSLVCFAEVVWFAEVVENVLGNQINFKFLAV